MSQAPKQILVADDDPEIRALIIDILDGCGYEIHPCSSGRRALDYLKEKGFDLAVVDIRMSGMSGIELLQQVRKMKLDTQIIIMTAYASVETAVQALRGYAFDYLIKPFSPGEFRRRVGEALQAQPPAVRRGLRYYQDLAVDRTARRVWMAGREIALTRLEYDLLEYLFARQGCPVSCQELLEQVWKCAEPGGYRASAVKACVCRLRKKIGDDAHRPSYILNEWGQGYRLGY